MAEITIRSRDDLAALRTGLEQTDELLAAIGAMLASDSQRAFQEQRFGDLQWPARYEGADEPFVNVAGLVEDLSGSDRPKSRRFDRRPAGFDTGQLAASPTHRVSGNAVEVGSGVEYAERFHKGGVSVLEVSDDVRARLWKWMKTDQGRPYRRRLGFLFGVRLLETQSHARPFIGITDDGRQRIEGAVEFFMEEAARAAQAAPPDDGGVA